jgi:long-subunit fatty acid transport protein
MKTFRLYGVRLLVALLLTLAAYNASGSSGSEAGATWTLRVPGFNDLNGVAYGNGLFVAVGGSYDSSTILTSRDGVGWTVRPSPTRDFLQGVTYGNNTFVAVGQYGTILTSP